jgi:hypothetical protein
MTDNINNNLDSYESIQTNWCFIDSNLIESNPTRSNPIRSNPIRSNPIGSNQIGSNQTRSIPNKWEPKEDLYNEYNRSNEMVYKNRNMTTINDLKTKITNSRELFEKISKSTDISKKLEALDIKLYISDLEIELLRQNNIENLKYISSNFFSQWSKYLDDARNFIIENELYNVVNVKEILSNDTLKIVKRRNIDGFYNCSSNSVYADNIAQLNIYFNIVE